MPCGTTGLDAQIGRENTPEQYIDRLVAVFHELKRVLRPDGTFWLNIADTYCGTGSKGGYTDPKNPKGRNGQSLRHIKLPLLAPVIFMNTLLLVTSCFKTFDIPMAMTSGGPAGATTTIALQIYNTGFRANRTGYATAQSVILFLIICVITAALYIFQNRRGEAVE